MIDEKEIVFFNGIVKGILKPYPNLEMECDIEQLENTLVQALITSKTEGMREAAGVAQAYADRNARGEFAEDEKLRWIALYHRISGENIKREILALARILTRAQGKLE